jgi:hypothetical protein
VLVSVVSAFLPHALSANAAQARPKPNRPKDVPKDVVDPRYIILLLLVGYDFSRSPVSHDRPLTVHSF